MRGAGPSAPAPVGGARPPRAAADTALIVSLDFDFIAERLPACPDPVRAGLGMGGDSDGAERRDAVATVPGGRALAVLFSDGGHRHEGVRAAFRAYLRKRLSIGLEAST